MEEEMKIIPLLIFLCVLSGRALAAPAEDKTAAWWGHSPAHEHRNREKTAWHHTGRRHMSTHPARRRQF
jgi:hypothetical protein